MFSNYLAADSVKLDRFQAVGGFLLGFRGLMSASGILAFRQGVNTAAVLERVCFMLQSFRYRYVWD